MKKSQNPPDEKPPMPDCILSCPEDPWDPKPKSPHLTSSQNEIDIQPSVDILQNSYDLLPLLQSSDAKPKVDFDIPCLSCTLYRERSRNQFDIEHAKSDVGQ